MSPAPVEVPVAVLDVKDSPQLHATLDSHADPVGTVVFAPDGKLLASSTSRGEVKLWDVASLKERRTLKQSGIGSGLAFLDDGNTLAMPWYEPFGKDGNALTGRYKVSDVNYRGGIKLWDAATGKERGVLRRESPRGVLGLSLTPDGKMLAATEIWHEKDGKDSKVGIALWDTTTGKVVRDLDIRAGSLAFAPNGKTLAVSTGEGEAVQLLDVVTGQKRGKLGKSKTYLYALALAPDGRTLAGSDYQGTVYLWDTTRGEEKARWQHGDSQMALCLAFAPDGKTLAVGVGPRNTRAVEPGEIVLWDPATKQKRLTLRGHIGMVRSLAFNADGSLLASGGADKTIKLWDVAPSSASKR